MQIIELDKRKYQDYPVNIDYDTDSYYDLIFDDDCIRIQKESDESSSSSSRRCRF